MKVNELFLQKRKNLHLTQDALAKQFHCSHAAISDIERGITKSLSFAMITWLFEENIHNSIEERVDYLEVKMDEVAGFLGL